MKAVKVIPVGAESNSRFVAFGDESQFGNTVVYAYVIVPRLRVTQVEARLLSLKRAFRIPPDTALHCKVLFHEDKRSKANLEHLTPDRVRALLHHALTIMNQGRTILRYGVADLDDARKRFGVDSTMTLRSAAGEPDLTLPVNFDPKAIIGLLAKGCFAVPEDGSQGPSLSQCQIIASREPSMVRFVGRRSQAHNLYGGFSEIGAAEGEVFQFQPSLSTEALAPLLQLADVAAYTCSHAQTPGSNTAFFRDLLSRIKLKHSFACF